MNMANELYVQVMKKIWTDEEFKKNFKADPRSTLMQEGETKVAPEIEVVEQSPEKFYYVLTKPPADIDAWAEEQMAMAETSKCAQGSCHNHAEICDK